MKSGMTTFTAQKSKKTVIKFTEEIIENKNLKMGMLDKNLEITNTKGRQIYEN